MSKIIGYTTGVYDMFHIGHLNVIRRAKEQCDYLIVGVSTDELVQKEKNKTPVIPYEERAAIVAALRYVDEVVPQEDKNKLVLTGSPAGRTIFQTMSIFLGVLAFKIHRQPQTASTTQSYQQVQWMQAWPETLQRPRQNRNQRKKLF